MAIGDRVRITIQEFEQLAAQPANQDKLLELINGEIVEKMPTEEHGGIVLRLGGKLIEYVEENNLGFASTEAGHRLPSDEYNERLPDISFISGERQPVRNGVIPQMPDLAVEVKSPRNTYKSLREKADYYLQNGSRMVWLIFPEKELIEVYTLDADIDILQIEDMLDGGEVIPGFKIPLTKIFRKLTR